MLSCIVCLDPQGTLMYDRHEFHVCLWCRESSSVVKSFKNFKETGSLRLSFGAEGLHGGALLAVRSADFVCFYDWATAKVVCAPVTPWSHSP